MSEKLPLSRFRLSQQSDVFVERILPGFDGGVKAPQPGVGKHLFAEQAAVPHVPLWCCRQPLP
jgi:hypothetical protein